MRRKKLLLLSSFGGYGHVAASHTLKSLLGNEYDIDIVYPIKELRICGVPSGESFYNFLITNNLNRITNFVVKNITPSIFRPREAKTQAIIENHIREKKSDMVISLIPFVNYPASEAAKAFGLPFLMVTTDYDLSNWTFHLEKINHPNVKMLLGNKYPNIKESLIKKGISGEMLVETGLSLREGFLKPESKQSLRLKHEIPKDKKVILIMMGGMGGAASYTYAKIITQLPLNTHLIVCTGKNKRLSSKLRHLRIPPNNTLDIIPFTENIHELIGLSDLVITKPGPGTINEILTLKTPVIIDETNEPLFWEACSRDILAHYKVGESVKSFKDLPFLLNKYLMHESFLEELEKNYENVPKNIFAQSILSFVQEMTKQEADVKEIVSARVRTSSL